jgi:hypothetical protein
MRRESARQAVNRLYDIRNRFGRQYASEKMELLEAIPGLAIRTAADTKKLHKTLCFMRAFPDTPEIHTCVSDALSTFDELISVLGESQQIRLVDSGISGTDIHYSFSFEVAAWLARKHTGLTHVDWSEFEETDRLDELLEQLLEPAEADYFDSGQASTEEWMGTASKDQPGTDFDWLMSQIKDHRQHDRFWTALYNSADVPLRCRLADSALSSSSNVFEVDEVFCRKRAMRNRVGDAKKQIASPLNSVTRLSRKHGARLIDVAMASLAVRHRETLHFNYANPDDVYLADVGAGVSIAVTGLDEEHRYPLECTMGFLILSNGVPIGYGGSSMLFKQANTGVNIFDEYRGSEAAWLWVQVMRVFHALTGCTRYIANPYQLGSENVEALGSGAFWFYYRLGYRPVDQDIRRLARREFSELRAEKGRRTSLDILKQLASCDMHLTLAGARQSEYFDEVWIERCALLATRELARTGHLSRRKSHDQLARQLAVDLQIKSMKNWSRTERKWFKRLCPVLTATNPGQWSAGDRKTLVALIRAKSAKTELGYAQLLNKHHAFFAALKNACRRVA